MIDSYKPGSKIHLMGYTSTSENFYIALGFAINGVDEDDMEPVLYDIDFRKSTGLFQLTEEYTAYPAEREVLVQDGLQYLVVSNTVQIDEKSSKRYHHIKLRYPAF